MPTIRNKTPRELNLRIGVTIDANATLEVTADQAKVLAGHPLLEITADAPSGASTDSSSSTPAANAAAAPPVAATDDTVSATKDTTSKTTSKASQTAAASEEDSK